LNDAGFNGLRRHHMAVFHYPGPEGCRPIELADRAGMSRQAIHDILQSLERLGYLGRSAGDR
jgi:DNA-binding IclR family transcriptional regulator